MQIKPSTSLRNDYSGISSLAHETGEPIYITRNGEGDLVVMSIAAYEERERKLGHRARLLEAEFERLSGQVPLSLDEVKDRLRALYARG